MTAKEEKIKEMLEGKLYPGKRVHIALYTLKEDGKFSRSKKERSGYVVALHQHIFTVQIGNYRESFRYAQLFEKGLERVSLV